MRPDRTPPSLLLVAILVLAGCDPVDGRDRGMAAEPPVAGEEEPGEEPRATGPALSGPGTPADPPVLEAAPERPWLRAGGAVQVAGVRYEVEDMTMTFHQGDLVEHAVHDGVSLYRPVWDDDPPEILLVRQTEWLWTPLSRAR